MPGLCAQAILLHREQRDQKGFEQPSWANSEIPANRARGRTDIPHPLGWDGRAQSDFLKLSIKGFLQNRIDAGMVRHLLVKKF